MVPNNSMPQLHSCSMDLTYLTDTVPSLPPSPLSLSLSLSLPPSPFFLSLSIHIGTHSRFKAIWPLVLPSTQRDWQHSLHVLHPSLSPSAISPHSWTKKETFGASAGGTGIGAGLPWFHWSEPLRKELGFSDRFIDVSALSSKWSVYSVWSTLGVFIFISLSLSLSLSLSPSLPPSLSLLPLFLSLLPPFRVLIPSTDTTKLIRIPYWV